MTDKNFVNFHVLISHSPSCLNRDDMNMQKTAIFGGVTRVRISSQSLKRAMRTSPFYASNLGQRSVRTNKLSRLKPRFVDQLKEQYPQGVIEKAIDWMSGKDGTTEADAVAPWSAAEVAYFCELVRRGEKKGLDADKLKKQIEKDARPFREAMSGALDIALSGRMATSGLMSSLPVDGALAVAHAITTHAVEPQDVDWFTAVDDLVQESGETGAGHLDTQQFSSGVFYRYASLNIAQLQENLGGASRQRALQIAQHVFHMLATVVPSAKQQSFAAHNLADYAIVSFADQPISLVNAFEAPVQRDRNGGFLAPSVRKLRDYWQRMNYAYALDERAAAFAVTNDKEHSEDQERSDLKTFHRLKDLEDWIAPRGEDA
jgi:CRISPR system Cascade subunit CasC